MKTFGGFNWVRCLSGAKTSACTNSVSVLLHNEPVADTASASACLLLLRYTIWHGTAFFWGCYVLYSEFGTAEVPGWPRLHLQRPDGRWFVAAHTPEESLAKRVVVCNPPILPELNSLRFPILFFCCKSMQVLDGCSRRSCKRIGGLAAAPALHYNAQLLFVSTWILAELSGVY